MSNKFTLDNAYTFERHYDDRSFWAKLRRLASMAGAKVVYPALQLYYTLHSDHVPIKDKVLIVGALGYLIFPADFIPDFLPVIGITDDLTALMLVLRTLDHDITPDIRRQARQQTDRLLNPDKPHNG